MSHFTVLVTKTQERDIDTQLAPFDENREMPRHISKTRTDFIESGRKDVEHAKAKVAEYDADPEKYKAGCSNENHLKWINGEAREIATILDADEEALFRLGSKWYEDGLDENGNYLTTSNDDAKWDWYQVGGRWSGFFRQKAGSESGQRGYPSLLMSAEEVAETMKGVDVIKVKDIDWAAMDQEVKDERAKDFDASQARPEGERFIWQQDRNELIKMTRDEFINRPISHMTFAVLHDGVWYERGEMGWWAVVSNEKSEHDWDSEFKKLIESLDPEDEVTVVDCHI